MTLVKLTLGGFFLALGWIYFFNPNLVLALNRIIRETILNDRIILLERKKMAILFFCLSFIALYMGLTALAKQAPGNHGQSWITETTSYLMYEAMQDYCREKYDNAINKYNEVLKVDPDNIKAMKRLSYTYEACGNTAKARVIWLKLLKLEPKNREIQKKLRMNPVIDPSSPASPAGKRQADNGRSLKKDNGIIKPSSGIDSNHRVKLTVISNGVNPNAN